MKCKLAIASKNPVKTAATLGGFQQMLPEFEYDTLGLSIPSGVADQPMTCEETLRGARNRVAGAREAAPDADYWIGIEGGLEDHEEDLIAFAWIVIQSETLEGKSRTGSFFLPPKVVELVRSGMEMGHADDLVFGVNNSKQSTGATGLLTGDIIDRTSLYQHAVILALIPFRNEVYYRATNKVHN